MIQILAIVVGAAFMGVIGIWMISRLSLRRRRTERLEIAFERAQSRPLKGEIGRGTATNF